MELQAVNSSNVKAIVNIKDLVIEVDGRSIIELEGEGENIDVSLFDGASIDAVNYISKNAHLRGFHHHKNKQQRRKNKRRFCFLCCKAPIETN